MTVTGQQMYNAARNINVFIRLFIMIHLFLSTLINFKSDDITAEIDLIQFLNEDEQCHH